jgi:lysozyme
LANFSQEVGHKIGNLPIAVQVDFYDQYNAHRLATPKSRHRLSEFVHLVQQRYHRRVIVWSPDQVWQTLKSATIAKQSRWAVSNGARKLSQQVLFNEFDSDWSLKLGQQKQTVPAIYFNGSRHEWNQRYVR